MKRILICAGVLVLTAACGHEGDFDATGTFEATEVVVSAEAAGRILRFDAGEIRIGGTSIRTDPLACKRKLAYIPDNPDLYDLSLIHI